MAGLIRILFSIIVSAFVTRMVEGLMSPKLKNKAEPKDKETPLPTVDLKPCPVCGVYTAQPAIHCKN